MNIKDSFRNRQSKWRTKKITADAKSCYEGMIYHCRKLSAYDHSYAFRIRRETLGWPIIEQIQRPDNVVLNENEDFVIIKDGYVYSIDKKNKTIKE